MDAHPTFLTPDDVASHLDVPLKALTWWIWALREDHRYDTFEIARRTGGEPRQIRAPIKPIKDLQRGLTEMLTSYYRPRPHVHGFVPGRSPITNAGVHRGKRWILRVDLKDFFPSINFGRVRGLFMGGPFNFSPDVATVLAQLCCHDNQLPQGAPTSPMLSNFVCRGVDAELARLAARHHCHYTRYADDLCFSCDRLSFPEELAYVEDDTAVVGEELNRAIDGEGFTVNSAKTRLMTGTQRQRVTGIVVNERLNVPREYIRSLRNLLYIWRTHGEEVARAAFERAHPYRNWPPGKPDAEFRLIVRGRIQHVGAVRGFRDPTYLRLANVLGLLDETFEAPQLIAAGAPGTITYFTEGPTDVRHIQAALEALRAAGDLGQLELQPDPAYEPKNDERLMKHLKSLALSPQRVPCVGIFDRDTKFASEIGADGWKHLDNGVIAVTLATPQWRQPDDPICIEMLYPPGVLDRIDGDGRRVFLLEEFDDVTGHHIETKRYTIPNPKKQTLVCDPVFDIQASDRGSVALSKMAFATAVARRRPPYEEVDYSGFQPTFELIGRAVAEAWENLPSEPED